MSKLIAPQWLLPRGIATCSSTRIGGVNLPSYDSLNLGAHCGDNSDRVEENRKRFFAASSLPFKPTWLEQVRGKDVLKLTGEPCASKRVNASYSNTPGTVCAMMIVDYLPVLFCNRAGTKVATAHAGWRGLCANVLEETVSYSADNPESILAWSGLAIDPCAFEMGAEARRAFMAVDAKASTAFIQHSDKYLADTYQLARRRLAGVGVERIFGGDRYTYTENKTFFSYRRGKITGRMASFIWLI